MIEKSNETLISQIQDKPSFSSQIDFSASERKHDHSSIPTADPKFAKFLQLNELDFATFFPDVKKPSHLDKIKLDINDYIRFTYVLSR